MQPAVYGFGVAPANDASMVVSPAIVHLHGQSYGLVLLNTKVETNKHRDKLRPILIDSLSSAPLIATGYSGGEDAVYQTLADHFEGLEPFYWINHDEEPKSHLGKLLGKEHAHFVGGADFDRFMIDLVQELKCWPPKLFSDPAGHLLDGLSPVVAYPLDKSDSEIDLLAHLRKKIEEWRHRLTEAEREFHAIRQAFMEGDYERACSGFEHLTDTQKTSLSADDLDVAAWSFVAVANNLLEQAKLASGEQVTQFLSVGRREVPAGAGDQARSV